MAQKSAEAMLEMAFKQLQEDWVAWENEEVTEEERAEIAEQVGYEYTRETPSELWKALGDEQIESLVEAWMEENEA
jgi:hypothetical protein